MNPNSINTTTLAFLGDAIYEVYVRKHVMESGEHRADKLHRMAVRYVRADAQASIIKYMFDDLTESEQKLVKRARNHKSATKPKNVSPVTYKWATSHEALIGYLYLADDLDRLEEILLRSVNFIDKME